MRKHIQLRNCFNILIINGFLLQECNSNKPRTWTPNSNLACSDNNVKTRNDRCKNGECRGDPFACLSCQDHHNDACRTKTGYCVINYNGVDTCYTTTTERPGNQCQVELSLRSIGNFEGRARYSRGSMVTGREQTVIKVEDRKTKLGRASKEESKGYKTLRRITKP